MRKKKTSKEPSLISSEIKEDSCIQGAIKKKQTTKKKEQFALRS